MTPLHLRTGPTNFLGGKVQALATMVWNNLTERKAEKSISGQNEMQCKCQKWNCGQGQGFEPCGNLEET